MTYFRQGSLFLPTRNIWVPRRSLSDNRGFISPALIGAVAASRRRSGLDSDVAAYVATTSATDYLGLNDIAIYLKAQSLWDHCRYFSGKSAQNIGSGSTVYALGGWTSNNVTLDVGGTWASDGIDFDATDDRASITLTGLQSLTEMFTFIVQKPAAASSADNNRFGYSSFGDVFTGKFLSIASVSSSISGETVCESLQTSGVNNKCGTTLVSWSADAKTQLVIRLAATHELWQSKTSKTIDLIYGTDSFRPVDIGYTTSDIWYIHHYKNGSGWLYAPACTVVAHLYCKTTLTQAQREQITDYMDAL